VSVKINEAFLIYPFPADLESRFDSISMDDKVVYANVPFTPLFIGRNRSIVGEYKLGNHLPVGRHTLSARIHFKLTPHSNDDHRTPYEFDEVLNDAFEVGETGEVLSETE
jgi:hypothetical protein